MGSAPYVLVSASWALQAVTLELTVRSVHSYLLFFLHVLLESSHFTFPVDTFDFVFKHFLNLFTARAIRPRQDFGEVGGLRND